MTFKKVAMEFAQFGEDETSDFQAMLQEGFANGSQGPYGDYELVYDESY